MNFIPLKQTVLVAAIAFAGYGSVNAQVTTSNMSGIVKTSDGKNTTGATIKATHLPSGTVYSATANASGAFNLSNMRVGGPYQVEVTYGSEKRFTILQRQTQFGDKGTDPCGNSQLIHFE